MENSAFDSLDNWLTSNGIGLELQVAGAFKKKFGKDRYWTDIQHSYQYLDTRPDDNLSILRETDIVFTKSKKIGSDLLFTLRLIIECKHGGGNPVVLYKESSQLPKINFNPLNELWKSTTSEGLDSRNVIGIHDNRLFGAMVKCTCYSINSINLDGKSSPKANAQNSIKQLASSLEGVFDQTIEDPLISKHIQVHIPILVTKSPMFTIQIGDEGELIKESSIRELLIWRSSPDQVGMQGFWVIHFDVLDELLEDTAQLFKSLDYRNF